MSWRLWLPLLAFAGFLGLAAYQLTQPRDEIVESRMIGKALPYFDLEPATAERGERRFQGRPAPPSQYLGELVPALHRRGTAA